MEMEYFIDPSLKGKLPQGYQIPDLTTTIYSAVMQEKDQKPKEMKISEALSEKIIKLPWHAYWLTHELSWFFSLGANPKNFRIRQHTSKEKSHYASDTWDLEYNFPFGWKELQGIADRGTYDLEQHEKHSKKDLKLLDEETGKKILPMVVAEPALGVERAFLVFMFDSYTKNEKDNIILKLNPKLAPIKAAILPLVKKEETLTNMARRIYKDLRDEWNITYDETGSVGRRYARNDEIGTPFCITIDNDSEQNRDVTIRFRNNGEQKRVPISELKNLLRRLISREITFEQL